MRFCLGVFFFKQKTAYEMRISDWSSDVCSSDLVQPDHPLRAALNALDLVLTYGGGDPVVDAYREIGAADCIPIYNALDAETHHPVSRSEARRVGKECVSTCRSRWSPYP